MRAAPGLLLLLLAGCASPPGGGDAAEDALAFLASQRGPAVAPYAVEAAVANGRDPSDWLRDVQVPEDGPLLHALRPLYALALADADGQAERRARILAAFDGEQFGDPALLNDDAFAILALVADGAPPAQAEVQSSAAFLLRYRNGGLWSYAADGHGGVDTTGMAVQALAAAGRLAGVPKDDVAHAIAAARDGDGYAEVGGGQANCDSTVWAIRALALLGDEPPAGAWDYLDGLRNADGGVAYVAGKPSNALCTSEAAVAWGLRERGRLDAPLV